MTEGTRMFIFATTVVREINSNKKMYLNKAVRESPSAISVEK